MEANLWSDEQKSHQATVKDKVALQTEARMVNVNRSCKSRGCGTKDWCLTSGDPTHIPGGMVEKGLERESDEVIVGEKPAGR